MDAISRCKIAQLQQLIKQEAELMQSDGMTHLRNV